jgi:single-stranded-DNA-specific exonuclease
MLLSTEDEDEAGQLAEKLEEFNNRRRALEKAVEDDVLRRIAQEPGLLNRRILAFSGSGWHPGVVGVVCSRLTARFGKPCLLAAVSDGEAKGSGRSVDGFSLIEAIRSCSGDLLRFGGHPMAAGFTAQEDRISDFFVSLEEYAARTYPEMPSPGLFVDCTVGPQDMTVENIDSLRVLEPFGTANEPPVFAVENARIEEIIPLSQGKHLKIRLSRSGVSFCVLCFFTTAEQFGFFAGDTVDVAFSAAVNEYKGERSASLQIKGMRVSGADQRAMAAGRQAYERYLRNEPGQNVLCPTREEMAVVFRFLKKQGRF